MAIYTSWFVTVSFASNSFEAHERTQVEDVLFNVHRSILGSQDPAVHWTGRSEQHPLILLDIGPGTFEMFLTLVYPSSVLDFAFSTA